MNCFPGSGHHRSHYLLQDNNSRFCCFTSSTRSREKANSSSSSLYKLGTEEYFRSRLTRISSLDRQLGITPGNRPTGSDTSLSGFSGTTTSTQTQKRKRKKVKKPPRATTKSIITASRRKSESDASSFLPPNKEARTLQICYKSFRRGSDPLQGNNKKVRKMVNVRKKNPGQKLRYTHGFRPDLCPRLSQTSEQ